MDELKLEKWKEGFNEEAQSIEIEFASLFKNKKLNDCYVLKLDESSELSLELNNELPEEIKGRLKKSLITTKPEDSV